MPAVKKTLIVVACLLVVVGIAAGVLVSLVLKDDNEGLAAPPSVELLTKGVVAAGTGKEVTIGQEELNGFLAYLFSQKKTSEENPSFEIGGMYLSLGESEGDTGLYLPCTYYGKHIGVTARANVSFDAARQAFRIELLKLKAGRLSLPVGWALGFAEQHLPEGVTREGELLWVDASKFSLYIEELGSSLSLVSFRIEDGALHLQTTGVMDAIEQYIKEKLSGILGNSELLDDLVDGLGSQFSDFLDGLQNGKDDSP